MLPGATPTRAAREDSGRTRRLISNSVGYGTICVTLAMLLFFLIIPVGVIVLKAFYNGEEFTLAYFQLLLENGFFQFHTLD